jgi:hypothetical protein
MYGDHIRRRKGGLEGEVENGINLVYPPTVMPFVTQLGKHIRWSCVRVPIVLTLYPACGKAQTSGTRYPPASATQLSAPCVSHPQVIESPNGSQRSCFEEVELVVSAVLLFAVSRLMVSVIVAACIGSMSMGSSKIIACIVGGSGKMEKRRSYFSTK